MKSEAGVDIFESMRAFGHEQLLLSHDPSCGYFETLLRIFEIARTERIPTYRAADRLAEQRIAAVAGLDRMWMGGGGRA